MVNEHTVFCIDSNTTKSSGGMFPINKGEKFTYYLGSVYDDGRFYRATFYPCRLK